MSEGDNEDAAVSLDMEPGETAEEMIDRHSQVRKGVVSDMFDSSWQLDALTPLRLRNVKLPATVFVRTEAGKIETYTGPLPGGNEPVPDIDVLVRKPWPGALIDSLPPTKPSKLARSYIIKNHRIRGKFLPKTAIDLGVKPGPSFSVLSNGGNVITADGKLVTPEMVMTPDKVGGAFAVVELPSEDYIEGLLNREEWSSETVMEGVGAIIWILGKGILDDKRLADFRAKFSHLEHIISSKDCCPNNLAFESAAMAELRLHLLDSERFPVPAYSNELPKADATSESWHTARVGLKLELEPSFRVQDNEIIPHFDAEKALVEHSVKVEEAVKDGEFGGVEQAVLDLASAARGRINDPEYLAKLAELQADLPCKDAEFITLGTGSALPSKYRNVSATLMRVPGVGNYLFDCGENTLGQLKRVFGAELPEVLRDLKLIWISHLHADHHLGTAAVLKARNDLLSCNVMAGNERIIVASDDGMLEWLAEYSQVEDIGYDAIKLISLSEYNGWQTEFSKPEIAAYGLSSIVACKVSHCQGALAVVLNFPNGFKVAYSGDCRPSMNFARIGEGATVLIHEATFDNELQSDAFAKKHSTTSEALYVAKKMGAQRVLLTHFSQRYCKMPAMDEMGEHVAIVSFDYMRCKVGDFAKQAEFRPALMKLYEEEVKEKITEEIKEEAKEGIKEDIKEEVKEDTKKDIKAEIMEEAKEEIKDEIMAEAKEEIKDEIMAEAKEEIKDEIMEDIREETREQAREEAKGEAKEDAKYI
jgi:ribonuclease Z